MVYPQIYIILSRTTIAFWMIFTVWFAYGYIQFNKDNLMMTLFIPSMVILQLLVFENFMIQRFINKINKKNKGYYNKEITLKIVSGLAALIVLIYVIAAVISRFIGVDHHHHHYDNYYGYSTNSY